MKEKQRTYITVRLKDDYRAYWRQYMRKRRLVKREGLLSYPVTLVDARPCRRRNIKVDAKPSKNLKEYQRLYHRKYKEMVQKQLKIAEEKGTH